MIEGLRHPLGLALSGPFNELFVATGDGVGKFNAKTGAAIKRDFITGIFLPQAVAVWRRNLFVLYSDPVYLDGRVGKYDASTGEVINKDFIVGLRFPSAIAARQ